MPSRQPSKSQLSLWEGGGHALPELTASAAEIRTARSSFVESFDNLGALVRETPELGECLWSRSVALDRKHKPQRWDAPSGTVRREWCRYPQEAHLLDLENWRYRRLTFEEIAVIQGFDPEWFDVAGMSVRNRIRAIGDSVPPPLAAAIMTSVDEHWVWKSETAIEICAGAGGLASGALSIPSMEHELLMDHWKRSVEVLRSGKPWDARKVHHASVTDFDFRGLRGGIGLLSGGPPCQPWSIGGRRRGISDDRDLLAGIHRVVAEVEPEVFAFENVPGLASQQNRGYLTEILANLRAPKAKLRYGVIAGVLNAADFGVPQIRKRVIILGFRDRPSAHAFKVFDAIAAKASHRDPSSPDPNRLPWRTLRQALGPPCPDPGGWRHWIKRDEVESS